MGNHRFTRSGAGLAVALAAALCGAAWLHPDDTGAKAAAPQGRGAQVLIELVALEAQSADDQTTTLPTSQTQIVLGATFYLEIWAQTANPDGLASVYLDVDYDNAVVSAVDLLHTDLFDELMRGTIDNPSGHVEDAGGAYLPDEPGTGCDDQIAATPSWARVAILHMTADAMGSALIQAADSASDLLGIAICGDFGNVDPATVSFGQVTVDVAECFGDSYCDDEDVCTDDSCDAGLCANTINYNDVVYCCAPTSGALTEIDDQDTCTDDICNPDGTVDHPPNSLPPQVVGSGPRSITVTPQPPGGSVPVALLLTSPNYTCLSQYIDADGTLVDDPVFQAPTDWGTVVVSDQDIVPSTTETDTTYEVWADCDGGMTSAGSAVTFVWGDLNDDLVVDLIDIVCVLNGFAGEFGTCSPEAVDMSPCMPDGTIDLQDIVMVLYAFAGDPFPCAAPCDGGACCSGSICELMTEEECTTAGGTYLGDGTVCVPNPCS